MMQLNRQFLGLFVMVTVSVLSTVSCVHPAQEDGTSPPPEIYANMPLEEALDAALNHGGDTLGQVKRLLKRRGDINKAGPLMQSALEDGLLSFSDRKLLNASHIYFATNMPGLSELFVKMVRTNRPLANRIGWRLASIRATKGMTKLIERELSEAIRTNQEERVLWPEMATAVAVNRMVESYTLIREGLFRTGEQEFVSAMIALDSQQASSDFLDYLSQASAEELRQLTLVNVNLFSSIAILRHLRAHPVSVSHPAFSHLFLYSVSRNRGLGELAQTVIDTYVPGDTEHLASILAGLPGWVQIAYLENVRRNMTTKKGLLVAELKHVTAKQDVIDEIQDLQR